MVRHRQAGRQTVTGTARLDRQAGRQADCVKAELKLSWQAGEEADAVPPISS